MTRQMIIRHGSHMEARHIEGTTWDIMKVNVTEGGDEEWLLKERRDLSEEQHAMMVDTYNKIQAVRAKEPSISMGSMG